MRARSLYVRISLQMTYFHFSDVCVQFLLMRRTSMRDSTCSVLRAPMRDLIFFEADLRRCERDVRGHAGDVAGHAMDA